MNPNFDRVVGIDTQILIHAYRTSFKSTEEQVIASRSRRLLADILQSESMICISSITLGEFLAGVNANVVTKTANEIQKNFQIAQYNTHAAIVNAQLTPFIKPLASGDRKVLSADSKILASIIAASCNQFFTFDAKFLKLAQASKLIRAFPLPEADLLDGLPE